MPRPVLLPCPVELSRSVLLPRPVELPRPIELSRPVLLPHPEELPRTDHPSYYKNLYLRFEKP